MKIVKYEVAGALYQSETGPEAQVGDQVKLFLDTVARPELPEFIFGVIQPGIEKVRCDEYTIYSIEYDESDIGDGLLRSQDIVNAEVTAAVDVVAGDLQDHIEDVSNPHAVTKSQVGLGNVDNTSDADKPVSTATQTALNLKAPLASPVFTGNPTAPTPSPGDNDTSVATTAFVATSFAPIASPTFTGVPAAPTASPGTSTTQLATTAFVTTADNLKAPLASPAFTGNPTAPTPLTADNDTSVATTAFVKAQAYATLAAPALTGAVTIDGEVPLRRVVTAPVAYADPGSTGDVSWDAIYFYFHDGSRWERIEFDPTWV